MKKMSAIEMVRLCETADDWIAMICKQCKIRRPSKASYWFNVCEAVFESLKIRPLRNCDRHECATTKSAQDVWRKEDGGKTAYYEWLLATSTAKGGSSGKCEEYGTIRRYAARDTDRIHELRALVGELADALDTTIHYRDFICDCGEPSLHNCSVRSRVCFAKNRLLVMKAREVTK